jgi:hypothetical protein
MVHFGSPSTSQETSKKDLNLDNEEEDNTAQVDLLLTKTTALTKWILQNLTSYPSTPHTTSTPLLGSFNLPSPETSQVPTPPISKGKQTTPLPLRTSTLRLPNPLQTAGPSQSI